MKKLNHFYGLLLIMMIPFIQACGLDNHRTDKEKEENIRQGGNDVDYKDAQQNNAPTTADTTRKPIDSTGYKPHGGR